MKKTTFVTLEQLRAFSQTIPTPFHLYDEQAIRENARRVNQAFAWNKGFKEYFAVKATPNPSIMQILHEEGCGMDCSSLTELMLCDRVGIRGEDIMFSSNDTPKQDFQLAEQLGAIISPCWTPSAISRKKSAAGIIPAGILKSPTPSWIHRARRSTA